VRLVLILVVAAALVGCGEQASTPLPTLPASALPELKSAFEEVGPEDLAADLGTGAPAFSGFVRGSQRVFQGESARFDRVVSRTLEFDDAPAADGYLAFLRSHLAALYGTGTTADPLESDGRRGILIDAASCACHRAEPTLAAVVVRGARVTYLEANGGGVKPAAVESLLALAP
jgi:hypothetical protein